MYDKDHIIEEIKRVAEKLGTRSLKQKDFELNSTIPIHTVKYYLGSWEQALEQAKLKDSHWSEEKEIKEKERKKKQNEEKLLLELIRIYEQTGEEPTSLSVNTKGKYGEHVYRKYWKNLNEAFLLARKRYPEKFQYFKEKDVPVSLPDAEAAPEKYSFSGQTDVGEEERMGDQKIKFIPKTIKPRQNRKKSRTVGEPIKFRGIKFAPIEKKGVIYIFSMVAAELGFEVESISPEFPDCEGKRCVDLENNQWEHIRIQFETRSSDIQEHDWNESECDLLVCWVHDWGECPIEILELKSEIARFDHFVVD